MASLVRAATERPNSAREAKHVRQARYQKAAATSGTTAGPGLSLPESLSWCADQVCTAPDLIMLVVLILAFYDLLDELNSRRR